MSTVNFYRVDKGRESTEVSQMNDSSVVSSSLEEIIRQQTQALEEFRADDLIHLGDIQEETSMEHEDDSSCSKSSGWQEAYELDSNHVWSEYEDDIRGKDVHRSIRAIKEEASRVDAAIALDQLDTMKDELESLRKELSGRDSEIKGLRTKMQAKDSKISTLELERQLHRADMGCETDDEEEFDEPQMVFSHSSATTCPDNTPDKEANSRYSRLTSLSDQSPPEAKTPISYSPIRKNVLRTPSGDQGGDTKVNALARKGTKKDRPLVSPPSPVRVKTSGRPSDIALFAAHEHRSDELSSVFGSEASATDKASVYSIRADTVPQAKILQRVGNRYHYKQANTFHGRSLESSAFVPESHVFTPVEEASLYTPSRRAESPYLLVPVSRVSSPRKLGHHEYTRDLNGTPLTARSIDMASVSMSSCSRSRMEVAAIRQKQYGEDHYAERHDEQKSCYSASRRSEAIGYHRGTIDAETGTKTCLALPKGKLFKLFKRRSSKHREGLNEQLNSEAQELTQLLRTSLETSDELRKRLAMINAYYENVVRGMQHTLETNNEDRQKMEAELSNQIAALKVAMKNEAIAKGFKQNAEKYHLK